MKLERDTWEHMMAGLQAEAERADFVPGPSLAPGSGTEGDDPMGVRYVNLGPVAFVLNEALQSALLRGADRNALVTRIAQAAQVAPAEVTNVLSGKTRCPTRDLMAAFATVLAIDASVVYDAAVKGGCPLVEGAPPPSSSPGY